MQVETDGNHITSSDLEGSSFGTDRVFVDLLSIFVIYKFLLEFDTRCVYPTSSLSINALLMNGWASASQ